MNESYTDLPERIRKSFSEIDSDIVVDLRTQVKSMPIYSTD